MWKKVFGKKALRVLGILVVIVLLGAMGGCCIPTDSESDVGDGGTTTNPVTYEKVDLKKMLDDLDGNALKAEKTYQDKYVEVTGAIRNFDSDGDYISIEPVNADPWDFSLVSVMCYIEDDAQIDYLLEKEVGDKVTIKGQIYSIGEILGYSIKIAEVS